MLLSVPKVSALNRFIYIPRCNSAFPNCWLLLWPLEVIWILFISKVSPAPSSVSHPLDESVSRLTLNIKCSRSVLSPRSSRLLSLTLVALNHCLVFASSVVVAIARSWTWSGTHFWSLIHFLVLLLLPSSIPCFLFSWKKQLYCYFPCNRYPSHSGFSKVIGYEETCRLEF